MSENKPSIEKLEKQVRVLKKKLERSEWHRVDLENQHDRDQHLYRRLHADLEAAHRKAQVEAALERVRSVAMAMHSSDDLTGISETVFTELKALGFADLRNTEIIINHETEESITSYYYSDYGVTGVIDVAYNTNPILAAWARDMQKADDAFAEVVIAEDEMEDWRSYRLSLGYVPDPKLDEATSVYYYSYSIGLGALSISSFQPVSAERLNVLAQFRNVFNLAYQRYVDIARAEAQAREAQIEAAMERVRSRALAMTSSNELLDVIFKIHKEFSGLGLPCGAFWHTRYTPESYHKALTGIGGEKLAAIMELPRDFTSNPALAAWERGGEKVGVFKFETAAACQYHHHMVTKGKFFEVDPEAITQEMIRENNGWTFVQARTSHGEIGYSLWGETEPSDEAMDVLVRFANAFDLAYRRFLDLQQAEEQTREAQVQLALERIRTQSLRMQHSSELVATSAVFHEQLLALGVATEFSYVWLPDEAAGKHQFWATWTSEEDGTPAHHSRAITYDLDRSEPYTAACFAAWASDDPIHVEQIPPGDVEHFFATWAELVGGAEHLRPKRFLDGIYYAEGYMAYGCFGINIRRAPTEAERDILRRFAVEFERTYTRFLDLKKAEAQAREAEIEASLERVRARAMAMHSSDDLSDATAIVFTELEKLGISTLRCGIVIIHETRHMDTWTATATSEDKDVRIVGRIDTTIHPLLEGVFEAWKAQQPFFTYELADEDLQSYYQALRNAPDYAFPQDARPSARQFHYTFFFPEGALFTFSEQPLAEDSIQIFSRFAAVFALTYRRYLDLKKAEEQLREAQIEAALERVRSRTMAMRKPDELQEVVSLVAERLMNLGVVTDAGGVIICTYFPDSKDVLHWMSTPDFSSSKPYLLPYFDHPIFEEAWQSKESGDAFFSKAYAVEEKNSFFQHAFEHSDYKYFPDEFKEWILATEHHALTFAWSRHSAILIPSFTGIFPSESDKEILKRFARVFEQAYIRFLDLQQAEERTRVAERQAALDRVRAEIASMRTAADLERITPLVWRELTTLGVPFFRCGVFIIAEAAEVVQVFLTNPEGKALAVLQLGFDDAPLVAATVAHWRQEAVYTEEWDAAQMRDWTRFLQERGLIETSRRYLDAEVPPEHLALHFVPFEQGMLYVGSREPLRAEDLETVQALADAFAVAYARYEDFQRLETKNQEVEAALTDLKTTQQQLVHSEKMASLGALTAGIAHEIKNPLNFITNFAEVNDELADELRTDLAEHPEALATVEELLADLKQNAQVIVQHGKRADSIVKSMMAHARENSGERQVVDLNTLIEEHVELAYHGKRAQVPGFTVEIVKEYDESIGRVKVVPQDIGRVILNLVGNAFDAVHEHAAKVNGVYTPTVTVTIRQVEKQAEIQVSDNGPGIPADIREKIFEPFFTTKPTGSGTGLGLSLSYDIVTKGHGGTLAVESEEGKGATFVITLPHEAKPTDEVNALS